MKITETWQECGLVIWIYCDVFTLIGVGVDAVLGDKTRILALLVCSAVTSVWGKEFKIVDH